MKELALLILKQVPKYFSDFVGVLGGPKSFVRTRNDGGEQSLAEALSFFAISFFLLMVLSWPLMRTQVESIQFLLARGVFILIMMAAYTGLVMLAWRMLGGRAPFGRYFVISCYYTGVALIFQALLLLCGVGVAQIFAPELTPNLVDTLTHIRPPDPKVTELLSGPDGTRYLVVMLAFNLILLFGFFVAVVWSVVGWGAYREINGLSKRRSLAAGAIAAVLMLCALPFALLIQHVIG